jgi:hypothetical protein
MEGGLAGASNVASHGMVGHVDSTVSFPDRVAAYSSAREAIHHREKGWRAALVLTKSKHALRMWLAHACGLDI